MAKRVLITGVSGFVGVRLAQRLAARGDRVAGTWIRDRPELPGGDLHEVDVRDRASVRAAVAAARPDAIVHLAGLSHVGASWSQPDLYREVNVGGTAHLLEAAAGTRVILASSAEVYGTVPEAEQPIVETRAPAPQSPYGESKAAAERLAQAAGAVVMRSFNLVGPGQAPSFALPSFARQLAAIRGGSERPRILVGNLEARRDFLHVDDGAAGYLAAIDRGAGGEVYNLGSGRPVSIADALAMLIEISGLEVETEVEAERWRPLDLPLLVADARRLRELGWEPRLTLRRALEELWGSVLETAERPRSEADA